MIPDFTPTGPTCPALLGMFCGATRIGLRGRASPGARASAGCAAAGVRCATLAYDPTVLPAKGSAMSFLRYGVGPHDAAVMLLDPSYVSVST